MMKYLCVSSFFVGILVSVSHQQNTPTLRPSVGSCPQLSDDAPILGDYTIFSNQGLLPSLFIGSDGSAPPRLRIVRARLLCEAIGAERGTASSVSFLVEYTLETGQTSKIAQVIVDCAPNPHGTSSHSFYPDPAPGATGSALNTAQSINDATLVTNAAEITATFSTKPEFMCGQCAAVTSLINNPATRCTSCISTCNAGLERCVGRTLLSGQCCSFFLNNLCVDSCPSSLMANPTTFDCGCATLTVANGEVTYSSAQLIGSVATYVCDGSRGYVLPGGSSTRTCTATGWTGNATTCELHDCELSSVFNPQNGEFQYENSDSNTRTKFGSVVSFTCDDKYQLAGDPSRTCNLDGWTGSNPVCNRIIKQCSPECTNGGTCDLDTGMCKCPPNAEGLDCSEKKSAEASTGGCNTACIIGIVMAVVGAVILVAIVAGVAFGIYSYLNHPDTKMAKFDNEQFNSVAKDNPLYVDPDAVVGDGAEAA